MYQLLKSQLMNMNLSWTLHHKANSREKKITRNPKEMLSPHHHTSSSNAKHAIVSFLHIIGEKGTHARRLINQARNRGNHLIITHFCIDLSYLCLHLQIEHTQHQKQEQENQIKSQKLKFQ